MNVDHMFSKCLLGVLCTFNLRLYPGGSWIYIQERTDFKVSYIILPLIEFTTWKVKYKNQISSKCCKLKANSKIFQNRTRFFPNHFYKIYFKASYLNPEMKFIQYVIWKIRLGCVKNNFTCLISNVFVISFRAAKFLGTSEEPLLVFWRTSDEFKRWYFLATLALTKIRWFLKCCGWTLKCSQLIWTKFLFSLSCFANKSFHTERLAWYKNTIWK